jgi:hypothetical protein
MGRLAGDLYSQPPPAMPLYENGDTEVTSTKVTQRLSCEIHRQTKRVTTGTFLSH